ncbi:MAG: Kae1-associated serine/threonine protein kinase [Candidatus Marsarchaeota archaeon]|nr:Kae1-associated serine/threonine protein kinase [Candidatus Marsarchaeota archaeon]MCL5115254.1 Kae1-associated serine/threonine protein kinase [Candidatus Marsarchaeota archaeon]
MEKLIGEGAEAKIYLIDFAGKEAVLKDRIKKSYRIPQIDEKLRLQRTRREARILYAAAKAGVDVPNIIFYGGTRLVMHKIDGMLLSRCIDSGKRRSAARAIEGAGKLIGMLHAGGIVHGDYTPANIMVGPDGNAWLIDFGLSEFKTSAEERALDLLLMKRSVDAGLFRRFLSGYKKEFGESGAVCSRLEEIERRGRYQTRTLLTA